MTYTSSKNHENEEILSFNGKNNTNCNRIIIQELILIDYKNDSEMSYYTCIHMKHTWLNS